ncbi:MAG: NAD(P)H-dependent oxidoreductase subunit E [candidate division Zixibacteria bacterium]|nr:NAD(P)H-dependent oxidoreductase subunit E [candidate division Zixibacteria bacterium]MBU1469896.1 NAD(P)H-dependent oxidoreductase subunit E [candidate division Zixibacteria bacterium]MBU2623991.1 NAD(P)H-dependent oxidoreductase subunit E [candidate division Zixibacteria bacterium]
MSTNRISSPKELDRFRDRLVKERQQQKTIITVCAGTGCLACGAESVIAAFKDSLRDCRPGDNVQVRTTGCHGFCERGPLVVIQPEGIFYQKVKPVDAKLIVDRTIKDGQLVKKLLYCDPLTDEVIVHEKDIPFYKKQMRLVFGKNGLMDPTSIDDYVALGGYQPLAKTLTTMTPDEVVDTIKKSGLRGRGGGGFLTGKKWASCRRAKGHPKYVICNADEGDPGAFMDRSLLEGNPHSVIEGMIIGAYAIGSNDGFVYVRNEYPLAVKNLAVGIAAAREYGFLGDDILGTGFRFDIEVSRGGGAFVCGESTALMASLEGKTGEPRAKYIHTVEAGLWDKPSNLNNVETWANVPLIIEKGADWYASIGTAGSKGTKVFALTGKVNNTGLVEVPMGITLREIVYDIGGGIPGGKRPKAVQTGGPSGGTLIIEPGDSDKPESLVTHGDARKDEEAVSLLDLPVDFDKLTEVGSMMGSGGMIVMDEDSCMVDVAKYFLNFLQEESCGKCLPCREGIRIMLNTLTRISDGKGEVEDIAFLEEISHVVSDTSLCDLGGSAPNPILSTIRYFRSEYLAHIVEKRCPAGVCKALVSHAIDENCNGCHACLKPCPTDAIVGSPKQLHIIDQDKCIQCGACYQICKRNAIKRMKRGEGDAVQRRAQEIWKPKTKAEVAAMA